MKLRSISTVAICFALCASFAFADGTKGNKNGGNSSQSQSGNHVQNQSGNNQQSGNSKSSGSNSSSNSNKSGSNSNSTSSSNKNGSNSGSNSNKNSSTSNSNSNKNSSSSNSNSNKKGSDPNGSNKPKLGDKGFDKNGIGKFDDHKFAGDKDNNNQDRFHKRGKEWWYWTHSGHWCYYRGGQWYDYDENSYADVAAARGPYYEDQGGFYLLEDNSKVYDPQIHRGAGGAVNFGPTGQNDGPPSPPSN